MCSLYYSSLRPRRFQIALFTLLLFILAPPLVQAAVKTWDGSASGLWNNGANWSGSTVPAAGDDLIFPASVTRLLVTNDFSPNRAFSSITFIGGSNYFLRGNALLLTNGISSDNPVGTNHIDADVEVRASQLREASG